MRTMRLRFQGIPAGLGTSVTSVPNGSETWSWRELPILRAALARFDAGAPLVSLPELQHELGLDSAQFRAGSSDSTMRATSR